MKKNSLLSILLISALFFSCVKDLGKDSATELIVKTTISTPEVSDVNWVGGAAVSLFTDSPADDIPGGRNLFCSDVNIGSFKGEIANDPQRTATYVIYPRLTTGGMNNIPVSVPTLQEYGHTGQYEFLVGAGEAQGNTLLPIEFKPICCECVVKVRNLGVNPESIVSIQLASKENLFVTSGVISSLDMPQFMPLSSDKSILCGVGYEIDTDAETAFSFFPGSYSGKDVSVVVTCANEYTYTLKTTFPEGFGTSGSVCEFNLNLNDIKPVNPGDIKTWLPVMSVDELVEGEYIIASSAPKGNGKYGLLGTEVATFTYPESLGDTSNTGKSGEALKPTSEANFDKWLESDAVIWVFKSEGPYQLNAETVVTSWCIQNKGTGLYFNMTNGQKLNVTDTYIQNSDAASKKQRWTIGFGENGLANIAPIQNTGRYLRYYSNDLFILTGLETNSSPVYILKLNPELL